MLIEVKAIGTDLKEQHVKQAVDYAANQGVDWVVLTNGMCWRVYKVTFAKPIDQELVIDIDYHCLNAKSEKCLEMIFPICKEGWVKSVIGEYHNQKQALSRFILGAMILSEPVMEVIRRALRRLAPDVRIELDEIKEVLIADVLKREVLEGDKVAEARKRIARSANKALRVRKSDNDDGENVKAE